MQPKIRNFVAISAHMRNSAGAMGPKGRNKARQHRSERKQVRQSLKRGDW